MKNNKIEYSTSGVNYRTIDPIKKLAQRSALSTGAHLKNSNLKEIEDSRGESAYVWKQGDIHMASVIEGLGTKNLVADAMRKITGKTYYDIIAHDTVASITNDLVSVGARPLTLHAYWAVGDSNWLADKKRMQDLIRGWKKACDIARVSWGGGETPALQGIINPDTIDLGGSSVGIITKKQNLLSDKKIKSGDRIILLKSNGINANGLSLARAIANKLPKGYATPLPNGKLYGETLLTRTNIYSKLIQDLFAGEIDVHYISNITGHGMRKIMRGRPAFSYIIEKLFVPQPVFNFMQKYGGLSDKEMYETFNMGQDYAIILPKKDVEKAQKIIIKNGFQSLDAGYVKKGEKQVILKQKNIMYSEKSLSIR